MFANVGPFASSLIIRLNGLSTLPCLVREVLLSQRSPDFKGSRAFLDYQVQLHCSYRWYQNPGWRNDLVNITGLSVRIYSCLEIQLNLCWNFTVQSHNMRPALHWFSSSSSVSPMGSFWNPFPTSAATLFLSTGYSHSFSSSYLKLSSGKDQKKCTHILAKMADNICFLIHVYSRDQTEFKSVKI